MVGKKMLVVFFCLALMTSLFWISPEVNGNLQNSSSNAWNLGAMGDLPLPFATLILFPSLPLSLSLCLSLPPSLPLSLRALEKKYLLLTNILKFFNPPSSMIREPWRFCPEVLFGKYFRGFF